MKNRVSGFTLIELIIVITIIGILAMIALFRFGNVTEGSRASVAYVMLSNIIGAEKAWFWDIEPPAYSSSLSLLGFAANTFQDDYFTYSFPTAGTGANCAFALRRSTATGRLSYKMDLNGAKYSAASDVVW